MLRPYAEGLSELQIDLPPAATLALLLDEIGERYPDLVRRLRDESGILRRHVNIFIGSVNARERDGLATELESGQEVSILPAISGG